MEMPNGMLTIFAKKAKHFLYQIIYKDKMVKINDVCL